MIFVFLNKNNNSSHGRGFTLIELIVVIVILGILAATAVPKFMGMRREARIGVVRGVEGGVRSALAVAQGIYRMDSTVDKNANGPAIFTAESGGRTITVQLTREKTNTGVPTWTGGGIPWASIAGTPGIGALIEQMDACTPVYSGALQWSLYNCANGVQVLQYSTNGAYTNSGLFFFPADVAINNYKGNASTTLSPLPACWLKYAVSQNNSNALGESESVVIRSDVSGC